jgi:hypothetical protein
LHSKKLIEYIRENSSEKIYRSPFVVSSTASAPATIAPTAGADRASSQHETGAGDRNETEHKEKPEPPESESANGHEHIQTTEQETTNAKVAEEEKETSAAAQVWAKLDEAPRERA